MRDERQASGGLSSNDEDKVNMKGAEDYANGGKDKCLLRV